MPLNTTGFSRLRLAEIKALYDQRFIDALGPVNTLPDSVTGQVIGIFSAALDDIQESLQDIYDSMYPASAEGVSLDGAVSFVGLERLGATATTAVAAAYGTEGTFIQAGALARSGTNQFASGADVVISRANALDVEIEVATVLNSTAYQIIAGGVLVSYISDATATAAEIAAGLAAGFNADKFSAIPTDSKIRLYSKDLASSFTLTVDATLTITKLSSPITFTSVELGAIACPAGSLTTIDTPVAGWDSISNLAAGTIGRDVESDADLRARHATGVRASGSATVKAIKARLISEVPEITSAFVYENRTQNIVDNMPPHSIECVIVGGADQAVREKIFELKPAGIETYGLVVGTVTDENGDVQTVKFSRPVTQYAWVRVSIDLLYPEETFPATTEAAIKDAVLAYGKTIAVGEDIIAQRFYGPIYSATTGIGRITVEIAVTASPGDTPSYSTNNIAIPRAGIAEFDISRITVV
jgi:uncharacterized phage protein gp47/JayE